MIVQHSQDPILEHPEIFGSRYISSNVLGDGNPTSSSASSVPSGSETSFRGATMVRRETVDIVILGGSYAGISVAHQFLRKTALELRKTPTAPRYRIVLVAPNTALFWNIGAPRAICNNENDDPERYFEPFLDSFKDYDPNSFDFIHGEAIAVDFGQKRVEIRTVLSEQSSDNELADSTTINYHALIIATGSSSDCELLTLHGSHERTLHEIKRFRAELSSATSCVIIGGGPSGVECAGQIATWVQQNQVRKHSDWRDRLGIGTKSDNRNSTGGSGRNFNDKSYLSSEAMSTQEALNVTLISGGPRLLGNMGPDVANKAERMLKNLGVQVIHGVRLISAQELPSRITKCILSHDLTISCDLFIAATGTRPNTTFIDTQYRDASGYIVVDQQSLRVPRAGERVYAIGSCAALDNNSLIDIFNSIPVLLHNLKNDLLEWEIKIQYPYGGYEDRIMALQDIWHSQQLRLTQLSPISKYGGVGMIKGRKIPSLLVWLMKGRDYNVSKAIKVSKQGERPYPIR
jgi:NADH dehydrogenase FAD-containing subunit